MEVQTQTTVTTITQVTASGIQLSASINRLNQTANQTTNQLSLKATVSLKYGKLVDHIGDEFTLPDYTDVFLLGLFGLGFWVLAHEAGHMAFSPNKYFNDIIGLLIHTSLLVPYFSWKNSHRSQHKHIANMMKDTSFVPATRSEYARLFGKTIESITEGISKPERYEDGTLVKKYSVKAGHYNPFSPLYSTRDAKFIIITDIALFAVCSILYCLGQTYGWANLAVCDGALPHYNPSTWTFTRCAASTIGRDVDRVDRYIFHNIIGTHVLHHQISTIPHYHARKAAEAIKPVMVLLPRVGVFCFIAIESVLSQRF
ncbi:oleate delta-12 desaturase [Halenospora varia]|nr:oleate delta-12 desaturase [Halenospora varia]